MCAGITMTTWNRSRLAGFYLFALMAFLLQAYLYYFFISDIMAYGKLTVVSIYVLWGARSYSIGLFLFAAVLTYKLEVKPALKWWHFAYWSSQLLVTGLLWMFWDIT